MDELQMRRRLRGLAVDRPPAQDLWPGIEDRLTLRRGRAPRRAPLWALAAIVVLAVAVFWQGLGRDDELEQGPSAGVAVADALMAEDAADTLITAWTETLALERGYDAEPWSGRAGAAERVAALRELDASLVQLASALLLEPESQLLRRLLHQTLQQRITLARDALVA